MILTELRAYLQQHEQVSIQELALHFTIEPTAIHGMLSFWIKKGLVEVCSGCHTRACGSCPAGQRFRWVSSLKERPKD